MLRCSTLAVVALAATLAAPLAAQIPTTRLPHPLQLADRGPVFFTVSMRSGERLDARNAATLQRRISLDLRDATIADAVAAIGRASGIAFAYKTQVLPAERRVTFGATDVTVEAALTVALLDAGLDVELTGSDHATLVGRSGPTLPAPRKQQGGGIIAGRVTDAVTHTPLDQASVRVEGSGLGAVSTPDSRYAIRNVPPGAYHVIARRVGYIPLTRDVTVTTDQPATLDFALAATPTKLDEVVTTAVGEQRRYEVGNVISTINADSIVPTAPITSVTDLLSGRAANVDVMTSTGIVGDGPAIRIRGRGSVTVPNDAIIFIDGVRADATPGGIRDPFDNTYPHPTASRLNDIDPGDIASVEVLRGPSAATEYGTDAANGVIVITTKRGQAGRPHWDVRTEQAASTMPVTFPDNYTSWGHLTDGTGRPALTFGVPGCPFLSTFGGPSQDAGTCVVDSMTRFQPLNHAATSVFGTGYRGQYDLQTSGGTTNIRYFLSGGLGNERGPIHMPPREVARIEQEQQRVVPDDQLNPNRLDHAQVRGTIDATVTRTASMTVSAGYMTTSQQTPDAYYSILGAIVGGPGYRDSLSGYDPAGSQFYEPGYVFATTSSEGVSRFTGSLAGRWQPMAWLNTRATLGIDNASRSTVDQLLPGQNPANFLLPPSGYRDRGQYGTGYYTVDMGATAVTSLAASLSSKTAVGAQYYDRREHGTAIGVTNLSATDGSLNGTTVFNNSLAELADEAKTAGFYVDETLEWHGRLFVTGALREDAGSGFGSKYNAALYPKASVSWVASQEPRNVLRFRAAYGQSGVQPQPGAALRLLGTTTALLPGAVVASGDTLLSPGNARLRPERSTELEGGVDAGLFGNRATVEFTVYEKKSRDALIDVPLPGSAGGVYGTHTLEENIGSVLNRGIEASLTARPLDSRLLAWDLTVSGSINLNRLRSLAPGVPAIDGGLVYRDPWRQKVGYPLYGLWALPISYRDVNHDGHIEVNEVTLGDTAVYVGPSLPTKEVSINTGVSLFRERIRIAGQLDARGGYRLSNAAAYLNADIFKTNAALNNPHAPLSDQARAAAVVKGTTEGLFNTNSGYVEDASFVRLREFSATLFLPARAISVIRGRSASVTLAVRNLALWTKYTGADPEVSNAEAQTAIAGVPTTAVNHDIAGDTGAVPQLRYWVLKVALGL